MDNCPLSIYAVIRSEGRTGKGCLSVTEQRNIRCPQIPMGGACHEKKGQKADRRIEKTRTGLDDALISMKKKDYRSITIREIIDEANVGRSTFYTHFDDKDDLLLSGIMA